MSENTTRIKIISIFLIILFSVTYVHFSRYRPKMLKRIQEIKGLSNIQTDNTPYPADAIKIGSNQTPKSIQTTFKTQKTPFEVREFYKNIYSGKMWRITSEKSAGSTLLLSFKKESEIVNVVITPEDIEDYTIVSIETLSEE